MNNQNRNSRNSAGKPTPSYPHRVSSSREMRENQIRDMRRRQYEKQRKKNARLRLIAAAALFLLIMVIIIAVSLHAKKVKNDHIPQSSSYNQESPSDSDKTQAGANNSSNLTGSDLTNGKSGNMIDPPSTERPQVPTATLSKTDKNTVQLNTELISKYGTLIRLSDHKVVATKNGNERMYPASMTKVMTLIVAYEAIDDLNATFKFTNTIIDPQYKSGASLAGFSAGEVVTIRDLLYGLILPSGAEAAVALAVHVAGNQDSFVSLMNKKAKDMGLSDTHFTNCVGMHNVNHYSTCADIAAIMEYALAYPECRKILSTYQYTTTATDKHQEGIPLESNMFQRMYGDEPEGAMVIAGKTGYTNDAGHCLVSYAEIDKTGAGYIAVTASAPGCHDPITDAIKLYSDYR